MLLKIVGRYYPIISLIIGGKSGNLQKSKGFILCRSLMSAQNFMATSGPTDRQTLTSIEPLAYPLISETDLQNNIRGIHVKVCRPHPFYRGCDLLVKHNTPKLLKNVKTSVARQQDQVGVM